MSNVVLIAAVSRNGVIGIGDKLPWKLKDDMSLFRTLTSGHTIVMGRKTYNSIGKPLPNRLNIIISRNTEYEADGCVVMPSIDIALTLSPKPLTTFVIGGAEIYKLAMPHITHVFLSRVDTEIHDENAVYFPEFNESEWETYYKAMYSKDIDGNNEYSFTFNMMRRK